MKKIIYGALAMTLTFGTISCSDFLDLAPINKITENDIFGSEAGIEAYMATLYNRLPIEDFNYGSESGFNNWVGGCFVPALSCDEAIHCEFPHEIFGPATKNNAWNQWWTYDNVRNVNQLIQELKESTLFAPEKQEELLGEAYAIRAWYYFGMAKRYGGVPIIKVPQEYDDSNPSALLVNRSTEEETYEFILEDLDNAIAMLPPTRSSREKYRINRYAAAALKSRAMLYAASIAKYGSYDKNGLVGFDDPSKAEKYYKEVIKAVDVVREGGYSLYRGNADKAKNYQEMFWIKGDCPEVIFVKKYEYPDKAHNWDLWNQPWGYRYPEGYGSRLSPTLDLIEAFPMADGTSGEFETNSSGWIVGDDGNILEVKDRTDLFDGRDSRLYATVLIPGAEWTNAKGDVSGIIDVKRGIAEMNGQNVTILKEGGAFTDQISYTDPETQKDTSIYVIGAQGVGGNAESTITGLYIKKFLYEGNATQDPKHTSGEQDWFEFRYAEIELNYAEAAAELATMGVSDYVANGLTYLNDVRDRAGVEDAPSLTVDVVRNERQVELMYENHRFWDLKRWRQADKVMNNKKMKGLYPYWVANKKTWIFRKVEVGNAHDFKPYLYYIRINDDQRKLNPGIEQNPGY
ncbi:RagB/SusD family nutrient uptake outer membrane protein [Coprobacter fastidiosus]|uniref:RagB/SusD family nutrient uptake outer membrane protein n=1 Tax=Coprobacter fastidiosus TaxID=1099853 RepID=UPI002674D1F2|nr:RagB/SusD family nutrient uptake outer membrane protein [Coprobacter fastidiosus]